MGRAPCCDKSKVKRGPWSPEEDEILKNYLIHNHGSASNWIALPLKAGLKRCGKSCRLRWLNYLRPDIKHGSFTPEEDDIIYSLYTKLGSRWRWRWSTFDLKCIYQLFIYLFICKKLHRWSVIASKLQGRTDNDVKNHWNTKLKKKLMATKDYQPYSPYNNPTDPQASISTPSPAKIIPKIEVYNPMFSTQQNHDYVHQVMPSLIDVRNYKQTQDQGSSISDSSQALARDTNFGISMDFGTGFPCDLMSTGIWNNQDDQMIFGEAGNHPPTNSYANSSVSQNVTNQYYI